MRERDSTSLEALGVGCRGIWRRRERTDSSTVNEGIRGASCGVTGRRESYLAKACTMCHMVASMPVLIRNLDSGWSGLVVLSMPA